MSRRRSNRRQTAQPVPVRAKFDVAQTSAENRKHWASADNLSARAALSPAVRKVVRIRSRYEAENNSWYAGILRTAVNHICGGAGPRLQLLTGNAEADRRVERAWASWCRRVDFADILRQSVEAYWRDGEVFLMRAEHPLVTAGVSLDVRLIEADQIQAPWDAPAHGDPYSDDGIRFDRSTNELYVYVLDHHPGGPAYMRSTLQGHWYRSGVDVTHLFRAERPGQTRGIPRVTPALQTLPIMRRQELATLYSAETAANFAMYLKSNSPAIDPADSPADFAEIELTRNMLTTLPAGWEIGQVEPKQPGPLYEMFQRQALQSFCRCTNMPYTLAAGTGKDANFSSFKGDMKNVWEPEVRVEQNRIEVAMLEPVLRWFFESAIFAPGLLAGLPPIGEIEHRWHWPPLPELDAVESANAALLRMQAGLSSPSEEYARRGADWQTESERAAADFGVPSTTYRQAVFAQVYSVTGTPQAPGLPTDTSVTTSSTAVADTAMNGAQVTSIVAIIGQVAAGVIPAASAKALIRSAFPLIPPANIDEMLAPFANVAQQAPAAPQQTPAVAAGEYTTIGQRAFTNNQKRIRKTLDSLTSGEISEVMADQTLQSIGLSPERSRALIDDALGNGVTDAELQQVDADGESDIEAALSDVDLTPSAGMKEEAQRGLDWRSEHGRGGTPVGIARARDIANGKSLSPETVGSMVRFFARHEVDKKGTGFSPGEDGFPSNGRIAWALWGGDAGMSWARSKYEQLQNAREVDAEGILSVSANCGTGAGGFEHGNECSKGGGSSQGGKSGGSNGGGTATAPTHNVALPKNKTKATIQQTGQALEQMGYKLGKAKTTLKQGKFVTSYTVTGPDGVESDMPAEAVRDLAYSGMAK